MALVSLYRVDTTPGASSSPAFTTGDDNGAIRKSSVAMQQRFGMGTPATEAAPTAWAGGRGRILGDYRRATENPGMD